MRYYLDTEFYEDGHTIDLISIGVVREDGASMYAVSREARLDRVSDWVRDNVLPHLPLYGSPEWMTRAEIRAAVDAFTRPPDGSKPEVWAYFADYDWIVLCQLFGTMMDLPEHLPRFCMDLKQLAFERGDPKLPEVENEHNALADARWNMRVHRLLESGALRTLRRSEPELPGDTEENDDPRPIAELRKENLRLRRRQFQIDQEIQKLMDGSLKRSIMFEEHQRARERVDQAKDAQLALVAREAVERLTLLAHEADDSERVALARSVAAFAHRDMKYGTKPYTVHLDAVAMLVRERGDDALVVAYLHDAIEDTALTLGSIENLFGPRVAACVEAVTDPVVDGRRARKKLANERLARIELKSELALAPLVKAADRLANVRACVANGNASLLAMYRGEHPEFREAVLRPGLNDEHIAELDRILQPAEGAP